MHRTQAQKELDLVFAIFGSMIFIIPLILIEGSGYIHAHLLQSDLVILFLVFFASLLIFVAYPFMLVHHEKKTNH
jgi:hypothetical protein